MAVEIHSQASADSAEDLVLADEQVDLPSLKQMIYSSSSSVVETPSRTSLMMMTCLWVVLECNNKDQTEDRNKEEIHLEAWVASVEASLTMTMVSGSEVDSAAVVCSRSRCK